MSAATGRRATHFCYPSGTYHSAAPAILANSGIHSATLVTEGINAPGTNPHALRRFIDGAHVSPVDFDAYLSGVLHYLTSARVFAHEVQFETSKRAAAASGMLICAV
jgi:hypothetical protein